MKKKISVKDIKSEDLDLNKLTPIPFDSKNMKKILKECDREMTRYKRKYGFKWMDYYDRDHGNIVDYDRDMKMINGCILHGTLIEVCGHTSRVWELPKRQIQRMKELFGQDCDFFELYKDKSIDIGEVLILDAIKSGKWKELPDELQSKYLERVDQNKCSD